MKHIIIRDDSLNGYEYGCLAAFEEAIHEETGADFYILPEYNYSGFVLKHFGQGMKRRALRSYFPKMHIEINADVCWYILMGPENFTLDLYKGWESNTGVKILYLFDTLPGQYELIKKITDSYTWDILITSFNDAVDDLQNLTGKKWYCVEQAADKYLFEPVQFEEKIIPFSSYGRRNLKVHEFVKEFCKNKGLYYDYTTLSSKFPLASSKELYYQYAWHMKHSLFTFSWPVEMTNPTRAGKLHPITCRWFEAAAAGTVIVGKQPGNKMFNSQLSENLVLNINDSENKNNLIEQINEIWDNRKIHYENSLAIRKLNFDRWNWNIRVKTILKIVSD